MIREVHEFTRISHARVERTLLSAAFDLDLDFDLASPRTDQAIPWKSGASAPRKALTNAPRLQPPRYHHQLCHPEPKRIRLMNPHAQSKDPCQLIRAQPPQGVPPESPGSESHRSNSKPDATVESHPSKDEGWGTWLKDPLHSRLTTTVLTEFSPYPGFGCPVDLEGL